MTTIRQHEEATAPAAGLQRTAAAQAHPAMRLFDPFVAQGAIDLTAFLGQWPTRLQIRADRSDLSAMADRLGLTGICVSHIASIFGFDTRSGNEALLLETSADERLWPFVIVNPTEPGWERELEWAVRAGARGIRLVPGHHRYSLLDPRAIELAGNVAELALPLHICSRLEDERLQHPHFQTTAVPFHQLADFIRRFDSLPIVLSGLRYRDWISIREHLNDGANDGAHVLLDLWFTNGPVAAVETLCKQGFSARVGYGSCAPIQLPEATALQIATASISAEERAAISRGNAAALLGI